MFFFRVRKLLPYWCDAAFAHMESPTQSFNWVATSIRSSALAKLHNAHRHQITHYAEPGWYIDLDAPEQHARPTDTFRILFVHMQINVGRIRYVVYGHPMRANHNIQMRFWDTRIGVADKEVNIYLYICDAYWPARRHSNGRSIGHILV